jgi:hypothetical protein
VSVAGRISRAEQEVLGAALVGAGVLVEFAAVAFCIRLQL